MDKIYRQGDVLIVAAKGEQSLGKRVRRDRGRIVLAYGEVTGHAHAISERGADLFELEGTDLQDRFLRVLADGGVDLVHEEHGTIHLPAGDYLTRRQREYSPEEIRNVAD